MAVAAETISVAAVRGTRVHAQSGRVLGRVADVEFFWSEAGFPQVVSVVVKRGSRWLAARAEQIVAITSHSIVLTDEELQGYQDDPAKWSAGKDLLDHQLLDLTGSQLIRVSDVYLQRVGEGFAFLGVDVSTATFFRRMLPKVFWRHAQPQTLLPWTSIQPFGRPGGAIATSTQHETLSALTPQQLAAILDGLSKPQRELLLPTFPTMQTDEANELVAAMTLARRRSRFWSGRPR